MEKSRFEALLMMISSATVDEIATHCNCSEVDAAAMFYSSDVYSFLERQATGFWHYSPMMLYSLFDEERKTGSFSFPEEAF